MRLDGEVDGRKRDGSRIKHVWNVRGNVDNTTDALKHAHHCKRFESASGERKDPESDSVTYFAAAFPSKLSLNRAIEQNFLPHSFVSYKEAIGNHINCIVSRPRCTSMEDGTAKTPELRMETRTTDPLNG